MRHSRFFIGGNPDLRSFDWPRIAGFLKARAQERLFGMSDSVGLFWAETGRQLLLHENGGECNVSCREPDGSSWELDFSVPYCDTWRTVGDASLAYRIGCVLERRQIDYQQVGHLDCWKQSAALSRAARAGFMRVLAQHFYRTGEEGRLLGLEALGIFNTKGAACHAVDYWDLLGRLKFSEEQREAFASRVFDVAQDWHREEIGFCISAAEPRDGGYRAMECECSQVLRDLPSRMRGCLKCRLDRGPIPEAST